MILSPGDKRPFRVRKGAILQFSRATITNFDKPGALKQQNFSSHNSGG